MTKSSEQPKQEAPKSRGKRLREAANEAVTTFVPHTDFVGKPFGPDGGEMHFRAGIVSSPVPRAWLESLSPKKTGE